MKILRRKQKFIWLLKQQLLYLLLTNFLNEHTIFFHTSTFNWLSAFQVRSLIEWQEALERKPPGNSQVFFSCTILEIRADLKLGRGLLFQSTCGVSLLLLDVFISPCTKKLTVQPHRKLENLTRTDISTRSTSTSQQQSLLIITDKKKKKKKKFNNNMKVMDLT